MSIMWNVNTVETRPTARFLKLVEFFELNSDAALGIRRGNSVR